MALNATRLRRALSLSSIFLATHRTLPTSTTTANFLSSLLQNHPTTSSPPPPSSHPSLRRFFHSTPLSLSSSRSFNDVEKIDPDTILFEGCDYKHWLIVMDFGKDPQQRPSAEEMVETYVQTLAKVVGSVEEAKKRMYACSTTTYTGFQAEIDEDTSKKFEGMPGVIFVLPDSYIDPQNKEYGGDKYINGTIIPRPPPVQYGRVRQNRQNSQQGEGRVFNPQRDYPDRRSNSPYYGPTGQGGRSNHMPNRSNYSEQGRDNYQGGGNNYVPHHQGGGTPSMPPNQGNYNHGYTQQHQMENFPGNRGTHVPHGQINNPPREHGYNHPQGQMRNSPGNHGGYTPQGQTQYPSDGRDYSQPHPARGAGGQTGVGSFEQTGAGQYGQGPRGTSGQETSIRYGSGYAFQAENQRFSQTPDEQNSMSTEHRNLSPGTMNQGRY